MYFFNCIQRGGVGCGEIFLILKLFIRCLLVQVREGLGISLSYKIINGSKLAYFLEESSMSINFLAPETSQIMALKIKDYIISLLLLAHHYLRLIVDDHSLQWNWLVRLSCPKPEGTPEPASWYIMVDSC